MQRHLDKNHRHCPSALTLFQRHPNRKSHIIQLSEVKYYGGFDEAKYHRSQSLKMMQIRIGALISHAL